MRTPHPHITFWSGLRRVNVVAVRRPDGESSLSTNCQACHLIVLSDGFCLVVLMSLLRMM